MKTLANIAKGKTTMQYTGKNYKAIKCFLSGIIAVTDVFKIKQDKIEIIVGLKSKFLERGGWVLIEPGGVRILN